MPQKRKAQRAAFMREASKRLLQSNAALQTTTSEPLNMDSELPLDTEQNVQLLEPCLSVQYPDVDSDVESVVDYDDDIFDCISLPSTSSDEVESEIDFGDLSSCAANCVIDDIFGQEDTEEYDDVWDDIFNATDSTLIEMIREPWLDSTPQKTVHEEAPIMDLTDIPLLAAGNSYCPCLLLHRFFLLWPYDVPSGTLSHPST